MSASILKGNEVGAKIRSAIKAKLKEMGSYSDEELPEYIMVMVANKRTKTEMEKDLRLFLHSNTKPFVEWLLQVLFKLKEVVVTKPSASNKSTKRKVVVDVSDLEIRVEKNEKKTKKEERSSTPPLLKLERTLTDEIPVKAIELTERRQKATKQKAEEPLSLQPSVTEEFDIAPPSEAERVVLLRGSSLKKKVHSDSEDEDFINIEAEGEELLENEGVERRLECSKEENACERRKVRLLKRLEEERFSRNTRNVTVKKNSSEREVALSISKGDDSPSRTPPPVKSRVSVHKRLGSIAKPVKRSVVHVVQEEEQSDARDKNVVPSVIKVQPRKPAAGNYGSGTKLLLMKAITDAQKSIEQAPPKNLDETDPVRKLNCINKVNERIKSRKRAMAAERKALESIRVRVNRSRTRSRSPLRTSSSPSPSLGSTSQSPSSATPNRVDNIRVRISALQSRSPSPRTPPGKPIIDQEDSIMEVDCQKSGEEPKTLDPKFIITLSEVNFAPKIVETSPVRLPAPKRRPPSPIVFDVPTAKAVVAPMKHVPITAPAHSRVIATNTCIAKPMEVKIIKPHKIEYKAPQNIRFMAPIKKKERCKFWPACKLGGACEYIHPNTPCKTFPLCKFGQACLYIHPKCKFGTFCTKRDCAYIHVSKFK